VQEAVEEARDEAEKLAGVDLIRPVAPDFRLVREVDFHARHDVSIGVVKERAHGGRPDVQRAYEALGQTT